MFNIKTQGRTFIINKYIYITFVNSKNYSLCSLKLHILEKNFVSKRSIFYIFNVCFINKLKTSKNLIALIKFLLA